MWLAGRFPRGSAPRRRLNRAAPLVYRGGEWLLDRWDGLLGRTNDAEVMSFAVYAPGFDPSVIYGSDSRE